jgi:hypothetical protein
MTHEPLCRAGETAPHRYPMRLEGRMVGEGSLVLASRRRAG